MEKPNGQMKPGSLTHLQLDTALRKIEDLMDRCQIPMFLLLDTARAVKERRELFGEAVHVGIKANAFTPFNKSMLLTLQPMEELKSGYFFMEGAVPVYIHIVRRNYRYFDHLDFEFYNVTEFYLPNPFDAYWKARHLIK